MPEFAMKSGIVPDELHQEKNHHADLLVGIARYLVFKHLDRLQLGKVVLCEGNKKWSFGQQTDGCTLEAKLVVNHHDFYRCVIFGGNVGIGETYMQNLWSSSDLVSLIRLFIMNRPIALNIEKGLARLSKPAKRLIHFLRRNSKSGSRKNILAHYDIGNDFFSLFLDESMMYSSAIYPQIGSTLEQAANYKIDLICRKLQLTETDHLLEIGSGWGALAIHAAKHYGCQVTTTTISDEQYAKVQQRIHQSGLENKVTILKQDYRDLVGQFDKLVSVEMFEAVGHENFDLFFSACNSLLKPGGLMLLQTITIANEYYNHSKHSVDFIQRYIFPGGCLPSIRILSDIVNSMADINLIQTEAFGEHYVRTLSDWRKRFYKQIKQVYQLGYSKRFIRMWEYYLCYCEAGFTEKSIDVMQLLLSKKASQNNLP